MRSRFAVIHGPTSIRWRFALLAVAVSVAAIAVNAWATVNGIAGDRRAAEDVALSVAIEDQVTALQTGLVAERTALTEYLARADGILVENAAAARRTEVGAMATIRTLGAGLPAVVRALDDADGAVRDWWQGFADPARAQGSTGSSAGAPVLTPTTGAARAAESAFAPVEAAVNALAASHPAPEALLAAANTQSERLRTMELAIIIVTLLGAFALMFFFARRWIFSPIAGLVDVATTLHSGGSATFQTSESEIGQLGTELDRMYRALAAEAEANTVVNRFVERVVMEEDDRGVAEGLVVALDELVAPDRISVHVSNRSQDRAVLQASKGEVGQEVVSLHGMDRCPGVRRSVLYPTQDAADRQAVICPLFPAASGTLVHVPLIDRECVGVAHLAWDAPGRFDERSVETIHRLMGRAALSIANRRMVMGLQLSANTDARTGLLNSRAFDDVVEGAMRDAPMGEPSGVLMLDVDHFKDFNDKFGHAAGDEALRVLAAVLRGQVRDGDIAARYGGEEFIVFLPKVEALGATDVAERIRRAVEGTIITVRPGETARITVSVGVATAPGDGTDRTMLVKAADRMLYAAKEGGRNRVATTAASMPGPESVVA
jgi:diguanylate cyclase (GGDEF)-like protein